MVRLKDIPDPVLERIRRRIEELWGQVPITSQYTDETIQKIIEREFGYRLSPAQIKRIKENRVPVKVEIPLEQAKTLEKEFGSVSKAVKVAVAKLLDTIPKLPEPYHSAYLELRGKTVTLEEAEEVASRHGLTLNQLLGTLRRERLMRWEGDKIKVLKEREQASFIPFLG